MSPLTRRDFLRTSVLAAAGGAGMMGHFSAAYVPDATEITPGTRPSQDKSVEVLHPRARVPLGFIIDDSTCLVNMGKFCMPQFRTAWPQSSSYLKPWKDWPSEIPDLFMREFGEFCADQGVKGKFSLVPYPACVGWLDRELPGWPRKELQESLKLIREVYCPNWDITPEMITHTRAIDLKTGRPIEEISSATMENSYPPEKKSVDELAAYIAYALQILKNAGIPATGVTTPGGFGNKCKSELSAAMGEALRDVLSLEIPFYFKYIVEGKESTRPILEHVEGLDTSNPKLTVNVTASTGDWFGNWDGDQIPAGDKYINEDGTEGRMAELINAGEPAIMFGHWAGFYSNGSRKGFAHCKKAIISINKHYADKTIWMKSSELARYQAARELTKIEKSPTAITFTAPFAAPAYTLRFAAPTATPRQVTQGGQQVALKETRALRDLKPGNWIRVKETVTVCFDLAKGKSVLEIHEAP
jgi:hypothetical protein